MNIGRLYQRVGHAFIYYTHKFVVSPEVKSRANHGNERVFPGATICVCSGTSAPLTLGPVILSFVQRLSSQWRIIAL